MHALQKTAMKYTVALSPAQSNSRDVRLCCCRPPSLLAAAIGERHQPFALDLEQITPVSPELYGHLGKRLNTLFPRSMPFSLALLHVAQSEQVEDAVSRKTTYYHAPPALLDEVMTQIRRSIRRNDYLLTHEGVGAAMLFPGIDERGMYGIIERLYHNISQIRAADVVLPLALETTIAMGVGSYPAPSSSVEQLLYAASTTAYRLVLPAAFSGNGWEDRRRSSEQPLAWEEDERDTRDHLPAFAIDHAFTRLPLSRSAPYMQLPGRIPARLKQLIPYDVARSVQCVPVGRNHHSLTVAMANPRNAAQVHTLQELTSLAIFPVSCDLDELQVLLSDPW